MSFFRRSLFPISALFYIDIFSYEINCKIVKNRSRNVIILKRWSYFFGFVSPVYNQYVFIWNRQNKPSFCLTVCIPLRKDFHNFLNIWPNWCMLLGRKERQKVVCHLFFLIIHKWYFVEYKHCIWETSY